MSCPTGALSDAVDWKPIDPWPDGAGGGVAEAAGAAVELPGATAEPVGWAVADSLDVGVSVGTPPAPAATLVDDADVPAGTGVPAGTLATAEAPPGTAEPRPGAAEALPGTVEGDGRAFAVAVVVASVLLPEPPHPASTAAKLAARRMTDSQVGLRCLSNSMGESAFMASGARMPVT
jgi:hypothetical protein